ncbi:MAG: M28 family peptidase, partial [Bacteroidia bacterium]|nr:M28 family peptidase [Bacteroidia bacterium]
LGTQYWTRQPHVPGYTASYGILLDMVGARGAKFRQEGYSREAAGYIVDKVWSTANANGFSDYFPYQPGGWVTDDHVYVNRMGIPSIDIIGSDPTAVSGFGKHWHTHRDSIEIIDPATLHAVGQTLLAVLYGNPNP